MNKEKVNLLPAELEAFDKETLLGHKTGTIPTMDLQLIQQSHWLQNFKGDLLLAIEAFMIITKRKESSNRIRKVHSKSRKSTLMEHIC